MPFDLTSPKIALSEKDVIKQCKTLLQYRGWKLHRNHVGKFLTLDEKRIVEMEPEGTPDFLAVHRDYPAFYIEFKAPGKKLRPTQRTRFDEFQFAYQLHTVMVDSLDRLLLYLDLHEGKIRGP